MLMVVLELTVFLCSVAIEKGDEAAVLQSMLAIDTPPATAWPAPIGICEFELIWAHSYQPHRPTYQPSS